MNAEFRKYLAYAIGEVALVIIGILIALQIDNWNEDRKEQALLDNYLESIVENMRDDLAELELLRSQRHRQLEAGTARQFIMRQQEFSVEDVIAATRGIAIATGEVYFTAKTSAYDSLSASALYGRLQGTAVEKLLASYYDTVRRIEALERSHYEYVRSYNQEISRMQSGDVEVFGFSNPSALKPDRFKALQPFYRRIFHSPVVGSLVNGEGRISVMLLHYDTLEVLSRTLDETLRGTRWQSPDNLPETPIDRLREGVGNPVLLANGRVTYEMYWLGTVASNSLLAFDVGSFQTTENALRIQLNGGAEWASVYFSTEWMDTTAEGRPQFDFSDFTTLELEMRGAEGGEGFTVIIKDADYPDYLEPVGVPVTLEKGWKTFELPLAAFAPNDLSAIHVPLGFNFLPAQEAVTFYVRNARYR